MCQKTVHMILNQLPKVWLCFGLLVFTRPVEAQHALRSLLDQAAQRHPAILAKQAQSEALRMNILLEENTIVPSLGIAYQANYGTANNITGMNYPASLIPISGPPSADNNLSGVFGSAAGLLFQWSPVTFGQREQKTAYHQKRYEQQLAAVGDETLKVKAGIAQKYLELATLQELTKAYEKNIERLAFNLEQSATLITAGIRPSADSLKFRGELSKARTDLLHLQHLLQSRRFELAELLVQTDLQGVAVDSQFFEKLPEWPDGMDGASRNPALQLASLDVSANELLLEQTRTSWKPKLELWSTLYARGSGIDFTGAHNVWEGWAFSRFNYGLGAQISYPLLAGKDIKLKTAQQTARLLGANHELEATRLQVLRQEQVARDYLSSALQAAAQIPVEYQTAEAAYQVLENRYRTGLDDNTAFVQAQYDLLNAEVRLKSAYVAAWNALLQVAVILGDMNVFLHQIER